MRLCDRYRGLDLTRRVALRALAAFLIAFAIGNCFVDYPRADINLSFRFSELTCRSVDPSWPLVSTPLILPIRYLLVERGGLRAARP
jgi:hypothetical protein